MRVASDKFSLGNGTKTLLEERTRGDGHTFSNISTLECNFMKVREGIFKVRNFADMKL